MGDNKWSQARRDKRKMQRKMVAEFEREYLMDEEERDNGKDRNS